MGLSKDRKNYTELILVMFFLCEWIVSVVKAKV